MCIYLYKICKVIEIVIEQRHVWESMTAHLKADVAVTSRRIKSFAIRLPADA
jgi:hypothetical protein